MLRDNQCPSTIIAVFEGIVSATLMHVCDRKIKEMENGTGKSTKQKFHKSSPQNTDTCSSNGILVRSRKLLLSHYGPARQTNAQSFGESPHEWQAALPSEAEV